MISRYDGIAAVTHVEPSTRITRFLPKNRPLRPPFSLKKRVPRGCTCAIASKTVRLSNDERSLAPRVHQRHARRPTASPCAQSRCANGRVWIRCFSRSAISNSLLAQRPPFSHQEELSTAGELSRVCQPTITRFARGCGAIHACRPLPGSRMSSLSGTQF